MLNVTTLLAIWDTYPKAKPATCIPRQPEPSRSTAWSTPITSTRRRYLSVTKASQSTATSQRTSPATLSHHPPRTAHHFSGSLPVGGGEHPPTAKHPGAYRSPRTGAVELTAPRLPGNVE